MVDKEPPRPDEGQEPGSKVGRGQDPSGMVDEILGYMEIIKKKLVGDDFSTLGAKIYNVETYAPEKCPECGSLRQKFFLLMQPGESLFDNVGPEKTITNYKVFCLECTKKINVLPQGHGKERAQRGVDDKR
ncbi:MAG: hypothetical protein JW839_07535 [Candidatus Lokiarchaeota archaeon]|nr:hypothetical protein [Candidatus Lokiarchaeota archaeon]